LHKGADIIKARNNIANKTGMKTLDAREFGASATAMGEALSSGSAVILPRFNVAVLPAGAQQSQMQALEASDDVRRVRPEFYMFAINVTASVTAALPFADNNQFTWGLIATGASGSTFTGDEIRIAVLDTGLDLDHPDFKGRSIVTRNFVTGSPDLNNVHDVQGHGTHTAGTISGPKVSTIGRRYGVAPNVLLHVGKVLDDSGSGREGDILNGMNWAIDQKCVAISMSLGRPVAPGEAPDSLYDDVGTAALNEGSLIIAAAGNESARDFNFIAPVGAPANSPSIMAVAAVDPRLKVAVFSCGAINPGGGEVNVSGPGVSVYSSFPRPQLSKVLQGTSMACPHVAGLAALWAQSDPSLRGQKLWDALVNSCRNIGPASDFGAGLARAPDAAGPGA
jgi:subtilisin family serine protease